jgi:hypothetical protein
MRIIKDKRNRIYKLDSKTGMIVKLSIEEGIKIEKEMVSNDSSIIPYTNFIKRNELEDFKQFLS